MSDSPRHDLDHDVEASMNLFKRAQVGEVAAVAPRRPEHLLLVLDGSDQDVTGETLAAELKRRFQCRLSVLDARETEREVDLAEAVGQRLDGEPVEASGEASYEQILDAVQARACDLVLVPCPFGRNMEQVGPDSTGTVIDVLLARSPVPLLVVRGPLEVASSEQGLFAQLRFVLIGDNEAAPSAATWATGLIARQGTLRLALILSREFFQTVHNLLQAIDPEVEITPEQLSDALAQTQVRLHRGLQKAAASEEFQYDFEVLQDTDPKAQALQDQSSELLLILALQRSDHSSQGHVQDRIRHSPHPVLVVPVE